MEDIVVSGFNLMFIVMAVVQLIKEASGLEGGAVRWLSVAVGIVFAVGYQLTLGVPADYAGWFGLVIFGIGVGLTASGFYAAGAQIVRR